MKALHGLPARALDVLLTPVWLCAVVWVRRQQTLVLRDGMALTEDQLALAHALGINAPSEVRVLAVAAVPMPMPRFLRAVAERAGWLSPHIAGMTLGHGIVLRADCCGDTRLLVHELAHVRQYERLGGIARFLRQYLRECVWPGYPHGALELEAKAAESGVLQRGGM